MLGSKLRRAIGMNVSRNFASPEASYIWENYSPIDGSGQGTHPFGWSALSALITVGAT